MSTTPIGTGADFDDSNVAMMASDEAHDAMREAAAGDKEWKDAGTACGVEIWRVENHKGGHFGIKRWPQEQFGKFYTGDAYIVLHTKPEVDGGAGFDWDIYFWLGKECSQDERGVAAYKTVELDELLGGSPTQHRIVNPHESAEFLTLFDGMPTFLEGGIESGFNPAVFVFLTPPSPASTSRTSLSSSATAPEASAKPGDLVVEIFLRGPGAA